MTTNVENGRDELDPLNDEPGIPSVAEEVRSGNGAKIIAFICVFVIVLMGAAYFTVKSYSDPTAKAAKTAEKKGAKVATGTAVAGKKFDPTQLPEGAPGAPVPVETFVDASSTPQIPAIDVVASDPIGVRGAKTQRTSNKTGVDGDGRQVPTALDSSAAVRLVSNEELPDATVGTQDPRVTGAQARLDGLQSTMKDLVGNLKTMTTPTAAAPAAAVPPAKPLGGALTVSATPRVYAGMLANRSLTMPKGTTGACALKTRIVSEQSGFVSCQLLRNIYSDDGRVVLAERGAHFDGEYLAKYRQGQTRIFVIWSRLRTSEGVTVDLESPATGPLGEAGVDGYVDNHWAERFGAAMLLTIIDDAVKISVAKQTGPSSTVIAGDSGDTMSKVAEKMLDSTVNIPPTIYKNQGEVVGIYVARDVDFSSVYELRTAAR